MKTLLLLLLTSVASAQTTLPYSVDDTAISEDLEYLGQQARLALAQTAAITTSSSAGGSGAGAAWTSISGFPAACTLPNVVTGIGAALTCQQPSSVTGNAATVTTNANLTGPVTSVGNATSIVGPISISTAIVTTSSVTAGAFYGYGGNLGGIPCLVGTGTGSVLCQGTLNISGGTYSVQSGGNGNHTSSTYGFGGGGYQNLIEGPYNIVVGGNSNQAGANTSTLYAIVVGGNSNAAKQDYAFVGGGFNNGVTGEGGVISGGDSNTSSGIDAAIPGGLNNRADGDYSFAAGENAQSTDNNEFTWGDRSSAYYSHGRNTFSVHTSTAYFDASGGVYVDTGNFVVQGGLMLSSTTTPTSITCTAGTGAIIAPSDNMSGSFTAGDLATACTVNFSVAWPKAPICMCAATNTPIALAPTSTTTSVTCTSAGSLTGDTIAYLCVGKP